MKNGYSRCTEDAMKEEGYTRLTGGYGSLSNGARKEVSEYGQRPGKKLVKRDVATRFYL